MRRLKAQKIGNAPIKETGDTSVEKVVWDLKISSNLKISNFSIKPYFDVRNGKIITHSHRKSIVDAVNVTNDVTV